MYLKRTHWSVLGAENDPQSDSFTFMAILIVHSESNEERKGGELKRKKEKKEKTIQENAKGKSKNSLPLC